MVRNLTILAVTSFIFTAVALALGIGMAGPVLITDGWRLPAAWGGEVISPSIDGRGPVTTVELPWDGSDTLSLRTPTDLHYTPGPAPGRLVITGPRGSLAAVRLENGRLYYLDGIRDRGRLKVVMTGPAFGRLNADYEDDVILEGLSQDRLELHVTHQASVAARGTVKTLDLDVSGSGRAHLSELQVEGAQIDLSNAAEATVAPTAWADIEASGASEIVLLKRPKQYNAQTLDKARIIDAAGEAEPEGTPRG